MKFLVATHSYLLTVEVSDSLELGKVTIVMFVPIVTQLRQIIATIKIAFDLKAEDVLAILDLVDVHISKHELSALFRKPGHKHFRECKDQILRNFLMGLQIRYRDNSELGT